MTGTEMEQAMLEHAQRQTKALENINVTLMALLVVVLLAAGIALIV